MEFRTLNYCYKIARNEYIPTFKSRTSFSDDIGTVETMNVQVRGRPTTRTHMHYPPGTKGLQAMITVTDKEGEASDYFCKLQVVGSGENAEFDKEGLISALNNAPTSSSAGLNSEADADTDGNNSNSISEGSSSDSGYHDD